MRLFSRVAQVPVVFIAIAALTVGAAVPAQAQTSCSDVLVDSGVTLVNPGVVTAGPIAVNISAGSYRLVMTSEDPLHSAGHQTDQMHEQWSFHTNTGYSSPTTPDLADERTAGA
ncbi:MAG: hypothetical protein ACI8Y4_003409 [Candidatus Poriferisodalaceae bacterium]|jgi:hypothetical protein